MRHRWGRALAPPIDELILFKPKSHLIKYRYFVLGFGGLPQPLIYCHYLLRIWD